MSRNNWKNDGQFLLVLLTIYRVLLYVISGIISWKIIHPKGFWSIILFFMLWGIISWLIHQIVLILFFIFNKEE